MHPAYSVIFFTTASGAGYGLLIWLGLLGPLGLLPVTTSFGLVAFALSFALITAGLLSSTAHLGRPERAWRAVSQWRSSWLSREGVAAIATYAPAGLSAIGWVFLERTDGIFALTGVLAAVMAVVTVICTGMIYASLPTIRAWYQPLVTPVYCALGLATGALLLNLLLLAFGVATAWAYGRMAAQPRHYVAADAVEARLARWLHDTAAPPTDIVGNNMEGVVFEKYPALPVLHERLRQRFGVIPGMSGSGSASFVFVDALQDESSISACIRDAWGPGSFVVAANLT